MTAMMPWLGLGLLAGPGLSTLGADPGVSSFDGLIDDVSPSI